MMKKLIYLLGFLGFVTLLPGFFDGSIYYYFRAVNGASMEFETQCFTVPTGWTIDSNDVRNKKKVYNIRKKNGEMYIFASVLNEESSIVTSFENIKPVKSESSMFSIYEIANLPSENTVRYWSLIPTKKLIVMGREVNVLTQLSKEIQSVKCK